MAEQSRLGDAEVELCLEELDGWLEQVERMGSAEGDIARRVVCALAAVYGEALARCLSAVDGEPGVVDRLALDPLVGHLMALHGMRPDPPDPPPGRVAPSARPAPNGPAPVFIPVELLQRQGRR